MIFHRELRPMSSVCSAKRLRRRLACLSVMGNRVRCSGGGILLALDYLRVESRGDDLHGSGQ